MSLVTQCTLMLAVAVGLYPEPERPVRESKTPIADAYREDARRIIRAALAENQAWDKLEYLCLRIGHRLSGSKELEQAIDWAVSAMEKDGQQNVRKEKVLVPHWIRGEESAEILEPRYERMHILGLGGSIATPPEGVTAPVIVVNSEDELKKLDEAQVKGKMVLFNHAMPAYHKQHGSGYGAAVRYRYNGARWAAEKGAVAALVRSVTAKSLRSPHTGAMSYGETQVKIPTAAVSIEDAEMMARLQAREVPIVVNLKMNAKQLPDAVSHNVVGELVGREKPEEIIVIGGHIDAWDVGHGAHDDGGGCVIAMEAINVLRKLELIPRRTIRVVLWTNEENGLAGGKAYAKDHAHELKNHVAAIESDSGVFKPTGYSLECIDNDRIAVASDQMRDLLSLFQKPIGPMEVTTGWSGADISPMKNAGVMLMGHRVESSIYFDYHHTHADTLDKVDPEELTQNVAVLAATAYILADMPDRLGHRTEQ